MAFESLTDEKILNLLNCSKRILKPLSRSRIKEGHEQMNYKAVAIDDSGYEFEIYKRQNLREGIKDDFSCGISWIAPNGETLTLRRYNGPNHNHNNHLENEKLGYCCHIHTATQKYLYANRKAEGYAECTERYKTIEGAFQCLIIDCNIEGLATKPEIGIQENMFD